MKLEFSRQIFFLGGGEYSNNKFHANPSSGSRVVPFGRKGGWTDATTLTVSFFLQFCEGAYQETNKNINCYVTMYQDGINDNAPSFKTSPCTQDGKHAVKMEFRSAAVYSGGRFR